ncbi:MAG: Bug family tripartite tricarboxylate transporter substrate binding protein [Hyphomicrobiaceae bacterium]
MAIATGTPAAHATEEFYKGKQLTVLIPFQAGSGYDTYARVFGRHIARHIPGTPAIVPSNLRGGGGLVLATYLYNVAPQAGTEIALRSRANRTDAVISNPVVKFDPRKFNWLGTISDEVSMCVAWHSSGFKTWEDLTKKQFIATASGATADNGAFPLLFNEVLGTKYKVVVGYKGGPAMNLAIERGEAHGRCGWSWTAVKTTKADWLAEKKINLILQASLEKSKELPNVPLVIDLAKNNADRALLKLAFAPQAIAWTITAGPGIPADRVAILRKAFTATMSDPKFLAEAKRMKLDINPLTGEKVAEIVNDMFSAEKDVVARLRRVTRPTDK